MLNIQGFTRRSSCKACHVSNLHVHVRVDLKLIIALNFCLLGSMLTLFPPPPFLSSSLSPLSHNFSSPIPAPSTLPAFSPPHLPVSPLSLSLYPSPHLSLSPHSSPSPSTPFSGISPTKPRGTSGFRHFRFRQWTRELVIESFMHAHLEVQQPTFTISKPKAEVTKVTDCEVASSNRCANGSQISETGISLKSYTGQKLIKKLFLQVFRPFPQPEVACRNRKWP